MTNTTPTFARSPCPLAVTLDIIGDKWSLIIIRDLFSGKQRFTEFLASPEGIKRNILSDRLKRLEQYGIIRREAYQNKPPRFSYHLTDAGERLLPVLKAMAGWAEQHVDGVWHADPQFFEKMRGRIKN